MSLVVLGRYELCLYWKLDLALRSVVCNKFPARVLQVVACRWNQQRVSWGYHL